MSDEKPTPSLEDLDAKLREARARHVEEPDQTGRQAVGSGLGFALRIGVELVAALVVGVGIGLLLDYWLGTSPWMMVVFFFLGSAAGFLNVYRAVSGYGYAAGYRKEDDNKTGTKGKAPHGGDEGSK
jgi:ATP synthase protein I